VNHGRRTEETAVAVGDRGRGDGFRGAASALGARLMCWPVGWAALG
jgi:hypothetical protein